MSLKVSLRVRQPISLDVEFEVRGFTALLGSSGRLELAINQGSAAKELGLGRGDRVRLRALGAAGEGP